jgi:hypothetical protein
MEQAIVAIRSGNFETARLFVSEIFHGEESKNSKDTDPGMEGSLLYHMAMVTKMEAEPKFVLEKLGLDEPNVAARVLTFFDAFVSDVKDLTKKLEIDVNSNPILCKAALDEEEKISLFDKLAEKTKNVEAMLKKEDFNAELELQRTFLEWATNVIDMRMRQEYETIKGFLILADLTSNLGIERVSKIMGSVQEKFGKATATAALNVTLRAGISRQKLQTIMLSDHYIEYKMNMAELEGSMRFLNCPIFGRQRQGRLNCFVVISVLPTQRLCLKLFCLSRLKCRDPNECPLMENANFTLSLPNRQKRLTRNSFL